jgi:nondiscriminating aspartyl-tRNA synthetase
VERLNRREFTEIFEIKYFDRDAYLAQSPQFYKEHGVAGLVVRYQLSY